jgi:hypothetical protein
LKSFTAEEQRTQRFAENTAVFLCGPLRPSFLCGEVLNDFKGPRAAIDGTALHPSRMAHNTRGH